MGTRAIQLSPVQHYLEQLHAQLLQMRGGEVASYIPELTRADPSWLGIAMVTVDGHVYQAGDSRQAFTIQSISKAITYGLALEDRGLDEVLAKVGVEPSGEAFNSISLEPVSGRPLNPMINAGAIATTGLVESQPSASPMARILDAFARYTGRSMDIDESVYRSESDTGHRNRAIAHLLYGHGIIDRTPEEVLDLYFRQCAILVTARDLAAMGACLANNGVNPVTGVVALQSRYVQKVLSVMSSCGMYDYSGGWIFNVGMPAKSGVGGGIMAVLPGQFGLGVFSPALDHMGNSVRGIEACKRLSRDFSLHLFHVARSTSASVIRRMFDCARGMSRRQRNASQRDLLASRGHRIRVYELQGELLFGGTESVTLDMLAALSELDYLVLDLKRVVAADHASILVLGELCRRVAGEDRRIFLTDCRHLYRLTKHLGRELAGVQIPDCLHFDDADHAIEWCEDQLIGASEASVEGGADLGQQYLCAGMSADELDALRVAGVSRRFSAGTQVCRRGDQAESLYLISEGEVEVWVDTDTSRHLRLTTLGPGMAFGEVALANQRGRTAYVTCVAETACLEVRFADLTDALRTRMLMNMASYFAAKIEQDTQLIRHLA
jgi:glutaminase